MRSSLWAVSCPRSSPSASGKAALKRLMLTLAFAETPSHSLRKIGARFSCAPLCEEIDDVELWVRDEAGQESERRTTDLDDLDQQFPGQRCDPLLVENECALGTYCVEDPLESWVCSP